jgi:hypothetical protein
MWRSYCASSAKVKKFGPPAGSSKGIQFAMIVVVSGLSGLTNAYRSVLSYYGVPEISGASRWLEAEAASGSSAVTPAAASPPGGQRTADQGRETPAPRTGPGVRCHAVRPQCRLA